MTGSKLISMNPIILLFSLFRLGINVLWQTIGPRHHILHMYFPP
jgi:hypothetical protein